MVLLKYNLFYPMFLLKKLVYEISFVNKNFKLTEILRYNLAYFSYINSIQITNKNNLYLFLSFVICDLLFFR